MCWLDIELDKSYAINMKVHCLAICRVLEVIAM